MAVVSSMEAELSYKGGQFNGVRMVMLRRWTVIEGAVVSFMEGERSQKGYRKVTEVVSLME